MNRKNTGGFATRAIHAGQKPDPVTGAVSMPIYAVSTYAQTAPGENTGFVYARGQNATRFALEAALANLEGGAGAFAFASGLAACDTALALLPAGSHVIAADDLFGGTVRLFDRVRGPSSGLNFSYVDLNDEAAIAAAARPETRMLWVETPTNPMLKIFDLEKLGKLAATRGWLSVCDNTFCSPAVQRPLDYGFDLSLHSTTKYINGHSDIIGGAIIARTKELADQIKFIQNAVGAIQGPFDSFLCLRGIKTLALRMERHSANALAVAEFLAAHPKLERTLYPGLKGFAQHELAKRQMRGGSGMITATLRGGLEPTLRFLKSLELFTLAESLGGVESLIEHPAIMTHASLPAETRRALGIDDGLVRISVGIEDADDLIADLKQALERA